MDIRPAPPATPTPGHPWLASYPAGIDWHAAIEATTLPALFDRAVARFADLPCTDFLGRRQRYRDIGDQVDRAARGFQALGVGPGSRVGLMLPNTPYFLVSFFAIAKCGGVAVNFNPLNAEREIARQIADSEIDTLVTLDLKVLFDKAAAMLGSTRLGRLVICRMADILPFPKNRLFPLLRRRDCAPVPADERHIRFDRLLAAAGEWRPVPVAPGDLAVLQYTGGTTGTPKGAMLTHANLTVNVGQCLRWFVGAEPGRERMLAVLPFFHVFAMTAAMNTALEMGAEIVMLPRFDLVTVLKTIHRKRITQFPAVPTIYNAIGNHPRIGRYDLSSLKICFSGGAPLPVEVKQRFEALSGCRVFEGYGLTESSPVAIANPVAAAGPPGSVGLPVPGTTVAIVSLDDGTTILPPGERGEVCLGGPQIMQGYWNRPAETAAALAGGHLHTGDIGCMDERGFTFIVDRIKDLILCSGFNVYPRQVEEAIYLHPAIAECVVAGVPDAYRGQTVKAYATLRPGHTLTLPELTGFLKDKLSPVELPKQLEIRAELPKTMIGKLSRKALLEEEAARRSPA